MPKIVDVNTTDVRAIGLKDMRSQSQSRLKLPKGTENRNQTSIVGTACAANQERTAAIAGFTPEIITEK